MLAADPATLADVVQTLRTEDIAHKAFHEPFYEGALTAVALRPLCGEPCDEVVRDLVRELPLALSSRPPPL